MDSPQSHIVDRPVGGPVDRIAEEEEEEEEEEDNTAAVVATSDDSL